MYRLSASRPSLALGSPTYVRTRRLTLSMVNPGLSGSTSALAVGQACALFINLSVASPTSCHEALAGAADRGTMPATGIPTAREGRLVAAPTGARCNSTSPSTRGVTGWTLHRPIYKVVEPCIRARKATDASFSLTALPIPCRTAMEA